MQQSTDDKYARDSASMKWHISALTLLSGASLAATPTAILAISSHIFTIQNQALIVIAIAIATFAGQLLSALTVESDLAGKFEPSNLGAPRWLVLLALLSSILLAVFPTSVVAVCLATPFILAALEVGRIASVAARRDQRELLSSSIFMVLVITAVMLSIFNQIWSLSLVAAGAMFVILLRAIPTWKLKAQHTKLRVRFWLGIDALAAGVTFPAVSAITLIAGGAEQTAILGMVASVSAIAALPASYLKMRLLGEHDAREILLATSAAALATVAIVLFQLTGLLNLVFGESWLLGATVGVLLIACVWRLLSLVTVLPFAALRRHGRVKRMVPVRFIIAILTMGAVWIFAPAGVFVVFAVLAVFELLTALGYRLVDK